MQPNHPKCLILRGEIWQINNKAVRVGRQVVHLRESSGCRALADAVLVMEQRVRETREELLHGHEHRDITLRYSSPGLARLVEEADRIVRPTPTLESLVEIRKLRAYTDTKINTVGGDLGKSGAPDRTRTCDPSLRRAVLYPTELRALEGLRA